MTQRWSVVARRRFANYGLSAAAIFTFLFPVTVLARAQSAEEAAHFANTLSSQSQTVIQRLSALDALPADGWKAHVGDLAYGEALDLDDSSWPIVQAKAESGTDAVWYRRSITVPATLNGYDLTGARSWFSFHADANGPMPEILYLNGRRVAMGDDLEPIVVFDLAKPGDTVLVAVKPLPTIDKKTFQGTEQKIEFSGSRPNPDGDSLILHAYEWAGKSGNVTFTVPEGATGAVLANLLEQPQGSPLTITGNQVTVPIHPFEILALRVDYSRTAKD